MNQMKNKKIEVEIGGIMYTLPSTCVRTKTYGESQGKKYIDVSHAAAGSLVKQYVKHTYKGQDVIARVSSSSFAGGNSLDVYVHTSLGMPVEESIYLDINRFAHNFEYGRFDGMTDCYDSYESSGLTSDHGTEVHASVKYVTCNNRASFGTAESLLYEVLHNGHSLAEAAKYYTDKSSLPGKARAEKVLQEMGVL